MALSATSIALAAACTVIPMPSALPPVNNLASQLTCDGAPQPIGGEIGQIAPTGETGTASVYPWLEALTDIDLPLNRWEEVPKVPWENGRAGFVRYQYDVQGHIKGVIVMAGHSVDGGQGSWQVVAFRACAGSEFDVADGRTVDNAAWLEPTGAATGDVRGQTGPGHCGWQSTVWLWFRDRVYVRDPLGVFANQTVDRYVARDTLPADATTTGYRSRDRELFANANLSVVWVKTSDAIERWPAFREQPGCA